MSMKLVIAIVQNEDAYKLSDALTEYEFSVTKLNTSGGFLKMDNITLLIGTDESRIEEALGIIKKVSKSREQIIPASLPLGYTESSFATRPIAIPVGGATVFIIDIENFYKF